MKNIFSLIIAIVALICASFSIYFNNKSKALALENSDALSKIQASLDSLVLDANIKSLNADQIIAKSIQIIDTDGNKRLSINIDDGLSTILLNDENGQKSVELVASSTENYIELSHMDGQKPRISIGDPEQEYAPLFFTGITADNYTWISNEYAQSIPAMFLADKLNNFILQSFTLEDASTLNKSFNFQVGPQAQYASPFLATVTNDNNSNAVIYTTKEGLTQGVATMEYSEEDREGLIGILDLDNNFSTAIGYIGDMSGKWGIHTYPEDESNFIFVGYEDTEYSDPPVLRVYESNELTVDWNLTSSK